jgi:hypothetical protein
MAVKTAKFIFYYIINKSKSIHRDVQILSLQLCKLELGGNVGGGGGGGGGGDGGGGGFDDDDDDDDDNDYDSSSFDHSSSFMNKWR